MRHTVSANSPVLSPKLLMSSRPSLCMSDSITLAIGVPSGALRCRLPASWPLRVPSRMSGQRRWLWRFGVGHRRAVHDHRLLEQVLVAFHRVLELVQEVRQHADVILVDHVEVEDRRLAAAVVRRRMEALVRAALREGAARASRPVLNEKTRVMSDWNASTWKSNISFTCSANESGTPIGASGSSRCSPLELRASTA